MADRREKKADRFGSAGAPSYVAGFSTETAGAMSGVLDSAGNRLSMTDLAGTHSYGYDDLYRLTSAAHPTASALEIKNETFDYDGTGNRLADAQITGYTYDDANRLVENSRFAYSYNADGDRMGQTDKLTNATTSFSFNSENQLVGATRPNGESWTYQYALPGRRIEKSSGTATSQKQRFVYDGDNILTILDGSNNAQQIFTMGLGTDDLLSFRKADATERFFHPDALESVDSLTDTSAAPIESYEYTSYGRPIVKNAGGTEIGIDESQNRFFYIARYYDEETGLQETRHRNYDPVTGMFISEDPIKFGGGINFYAYVKNNPTNLTDSSGLSPGTDYLNCLSQCIQDLNFLALPGSAWVTVG